jgi:hypothetical protein
MVALLNGTGMAFVGTGTTGAVGIISAATGYMANTLTLITLEDGGGWDMIAGFSTKR